MEKLKDNLPQSPPEQDNFRQLLPLYVQFRNVKEWAEKVTSNITAIIANLNFPENVVTTQSPGEFVEQDGKVIGIVNGAGIVTRGPYLTEDVWTTELKGAVLFIELGSVVGNPIYPLSSDTSLQYLGIKITDSLVLIEIKDNYVMRM